MQFKQKEMDKYHLRFTITPNCNFRCSYCLPKWYKNIPEPINTNEAVEILKAAYACGITRVHWTGGEPTIRNDFTELVRSAKEIGFTKQILTTNGYNLYNNIDELIDNGLTRITISLDTLNPKQNKLIEEGISIKGSLFFKEVLKGIEMSVEKLPSITKISIVTMKSTLPEFKDFIDYAQQMNSKGYKGKLVLKFDQFYPCNPAQLFSEGQSFWKKEFVSENEIMKTLQNISTITSLKREDIEGDNPNYRYYLLDDVDVIVGVLALFSWGYPCGKWYKLRIESNGIPSICISQPRNDSLVGKPLGDKIKILKDIIYFRDEKLDLICPNRKHYTSQLGGPRFGEVGNSLSQDYFNKILGGF